MKASSLKPGMRVLVSMTGAYHGTVISHRPKVIGRKGLTVVHVDEFAGLHGPDDQGEIHLSDYEVSRFLQPMEVAL
ncbi:hypothetical protein H4F52_13100 [Pectobacterium brasiliense]|uniref:hypothetical protein n=1 Tax=Pectobacterium brasiliense TaxID=180957 RepID=UPI001968CBC4|nr:hypothetical protein [Pectobacterium brasiliense]MBN3132667.1 hypothetical protein [Pectobacterium brasiliense]